MQALFSIHIFFVQRQFQETSHCAINTWGQFVHIDTCIS
jgi:hypothetical protein